MCLNPHCRPLVETLHLQDPLTNEQRQRSHHHLNDDEEEDPTMEVTTGPTQRQLAELQQMRSELETLRSDMASLRNEIESHRQTLTSIQTRLNNLEQRPLSSQIIREIMAKKRKRVQHFKFFGIMTRQQYRKMIIGIFVYGLWFLYIWTNYSTFVLGPTFQLEGNINTRNNASGVLQKLRVCISPYYLQDTPTTRKSSEELLCVG